MRNLKIGIVIQQIAHPEYGAFQIFADNGDEYGYDLGRIFLHKEEAEKFWEVVNGGD